MDWNKLTDDERLLWQVYASEVEYLRDKKQLAQLVLSGIKDDASLQQAKMLQDKINHDEVLIAKWVKMLPFDVHDEKLQEFRAEAIDDYLNIACPPTEGAVVDSVRDEIDKEKLAATEKLSTAYEFLDIVHEAIEAKFDLVLAEREALPTEYVSLAEELKAGKVIWPL